MTLSRAAPRRADALTGLRLLAALSVLFLHFGHPLTARWPALEPVRRTGFAAVSFFFVLSGFVLARGSARALADGSFEARAFLVRRLARLYPAHLVAMAALVPLALVPGWGVASGAFAESARGRVVTGVAHLLLVQGWWPRLVFAWNLPTWSLCAEVCFCAAFPFVARRLVGQPPRRLVAALAGAWAIALIAPALFHLLDPSAALAEHAEGPLARWVLYSPPARLPEFVLGVALGLLHASRLPDPRRDRLFGVVGVTLGAAGLLCFGRLPFALAHNGLFAPASALVIWSAASGSGVAARALAAPFVTRLGRATYSLFLFQIPLSFYLTLVARAAGWDPRGAPLAVATMALALAVSLVARELIERPAEASVRRWLATARPLLALEPAFGA